MKKIINDFLMKHGDKVCLGASWTMLPLSLYMIFYPLYEFMRYLIFHNTILWSYPLFMMQIAGLLGFRVFWLTRKGAKYYREHYCKKPK